MLSRFHVKYSLSILLKVLSSILVTELIIMLTFNWLSLEKWMSPLMFGLLDAVLLTAVTSLVMLYWVVEPIRIIEKQKREDDVRAVVVELKESEKRFRLPFQKSPVGIFHYNTNLQLTDCNKRFVEILQSSREKLIGLDMKTLEDQSVFPAISKAIEGMDGIYEGLYRTTTSFAEIWVSMKTTPIFGSEGRITGGIGIVEDITERKKMEKELKDKIEELEKFYEMAIGRELKMKELKEELARLKTKLSK